MGEIFVHKGKISVPEKIKTFTDKGEKFIHKRFRGLYFHKIIFF